MKAPTREEIYSVFIETDMGFYDIRLPSQHGWKNVFVFSNRDASELYGHLCLTYHKGGIRVSSGILLHPEEMSKEWFFSHYETVEELVEDITKFTHKYVNSFELKRKK